MMDVRRNTLWLQSARAELLGESNVTEQRHGFTGLRAQISFGKIGTIVHLTSRAQQALFLGCGRILL